MNDLLWWGLILILIAICVWAWKTTKREDEIEDELAQHVVDELRRRDDESS